MAESKVIEALKKRMNASRERAEALTKAGEHRRAAALDGLADGLSLAIESIEAEAKARIDARSIPALHLVRCEASVADSSTLDAARIVLRPLCEEGRRLLLNLSDGTDVLCGLAPAGEVTHG